MQENMALDSKIKVDKLVGKTNWAKWKWQINMHFEQCDMMSIIDGSRKSPNITNTEKVSEDDQKTFLAWERDNARTAALIACALSQPVADLVLTYLDCKDIGHKLISVYEQSIQPLAVDDGILQAPARTRNGHCCLCR